MPQSEKKNRATPGAMFDQAHFGRTLRVAMARKKITQAQLAEAIAQRTGRSFAQTTISYWLRTDDSAKVPSIRVLPALLDVLDLTWSDLFPQAPMNQPGSLTVADPAALVTVPRYAVKDSRLRRTRKKMTFDASMAGDVAHERLGGLIVPAGWDNMIRYVRSGDRMLLDVYERPASLRQRFRDGAFKNGVYLVSFAAGIQIHRLQELPRALVAVLSDNEAYRDVELDLNVGDDLTIHARVLAAEGSS